MKWLGIIAACIAVLLASTWGAFRFWINPTVVREIRVNPDGEEARKVMLLTLPSGKAIPVNYLREGSTVYAAADFPWWRELEGKGGRGSVMIRGKTHPGHIRAVLDDPEWRKQVFAKLRPTAPLFFGTMIVIDLDESSKGSGYLRGQTVSLQAGRRMRRPDNAPPSLRTAQRHNSRDLRPPT